MDSELYVVIQYHHRPYYNPQRNIKQTKNLNNTNKHFFCNFFFRIFNFFNFFMNVRHENAVASRPEHRLKARQPHRSCPTYFMVFNINITMPKYQKV